MRKPKSLKIEKIYRDHIDSLNASIQEDSWGYYVYFEGEGNCIGPTGAKQLQKWLDSAVKWIKVNRPKANPSIVGTKK